MATRATSKPLRREVDGGMEGPLIIEVREDTVTLRPKYTRAGGPAEIVARWGWIYQQAMLRRGYRT